MSISLLENNWKQMKIKVIDKLWFHKFKGMYEACKLDKDDFDSLANIVLTKAFKQDYNQEVSSIFTYATNVLDRKAKSELTYYHREKRGRGVPEISMQQMIDEENDIEVEDMIEVEREEDIGHLAQRYVDSLPKMQKQVAELIMLGYDNQLIKKELKLSDDRFKMIIKRMRAKEKIEPLEKLRGVRK